MYRKINVVSTKMNLITPFFKGGRGDFFIPYDKIPLNLPFRKGDLIESIIFMLSWCPLQTMRIY